MRVCVRGRGGTWLTLHLNNSIIFILCDHGRIHTHFKLNMGVGMVLPGSAVRILILSLRVSSCCSLLVMKEQQLSPLSPIVANIFKVRT